MSFVQSFAGSVFFSLLVLLVSGSKVGAEQGTGFSIIQLREISYEHAPAIRIRFSEPLVPEKIKGKVRLALYKGERIETMHRDIPWILDSDKRTVIFPFVEPSAKYEVQVDAGITSANGNILGQYYSNTIKTKYISPQANFSSTGYIMPLSGPKTLPVTVTNVDKVNIDFYYISPNKYDAFLKSGLGAGTEYNYQLNRFIEQSKFIYSSRFEVAHKKNQRTFVNLDVSHITDIQQPGLYIAVMSKAGKYEDSQSVIYFTVSDLVVHLRQYQKKSVVHVMDIIRGEPVEDVKAFIYDKEGRLISSNNTNGIGVAELVTYDSNKGRYLIAKKERNITILPLNRQPLDLSDFSNALSPHSDIQAFSFGPRDLFRPGETASVQVLLRDFDGQQLSNIPLGLTLTRPDGQVAINTVLQPQASGYYQFDYQLSNSSPTGNWKVSYQALGQKLTQNYYFKVEEFRPNRLQLEQLVKQENLLGESSEKFVLRNTDKLKNALSGAYLFGAKASGNKVDGVLNASFDRHPVPHLKAYHFGDQREKLYFRNRHLSELNLNQVGEGEITLKNTWAKFKSPLRLTYTLSLYDGGGQPTTSKQSVTLIKDKGLVGIKPEFSGEPDKNAKIDFSVVSLDSQLNVVTNDILKVALVKEDRNYYWSHDNYGGWQFKYDASPYEVWSSEQVTDKTGKVSFEVPLEYGHYQLVVTQPLSGVTSTFNFKTAGRWWGNSRESKNKPETLLMSFDKAQYEAGEKAVLSYFVPHDGRAWFTVENNQGVLLQQSFIVQQGEQQLDFDLPDSWSRHDYYATLMIVKHDSEQNVSKSRAFGLAHIPLKRKDMTLAVNLSAPESSLPLNTLNANVKVAAPENLSGPTYAVVALVDVGILNITKYHRPRPEEYFLAPRRYQVELFDVYDKLIEQNLGRTLSQVFGGDLVESEDEMARGGKRPDADVELLSLLSAPVQLDSNGEARISFDLPDFVGKLRWSVVVFNKNQFGSAEQFTRVSSPFVSQLSSPYFLAPGDSSKSVLELHNTTEQEQQLNLTVSISGGLEQSTIEETYTLEPGQKLNADIALKSNGTLKDGQISYKLQSVDKESRYRVEKQHILPMRLAYPLITERSYFNLDEDEQWQADIKIDKAFPGSAYGQLTLSATPPLELNDYFDFLLSYPYGCLEQTTSRALPWLSIDKRLVEQYSLSEQIEKRLNEPFSEELRLSALLKAIDELKQKQRADGSYSLWSGSANEYSWLTVYAAELLVDAAKAGVQVPSNMVNQSLRVLRKYLRRPASIKSTSWIEDQIYYISSTRAYAGYVLAKANRANLSDLRRFSTELEETGSMPWVHLAASFKLLGAAKDSKNALAKVQVFSRPEGYLGDYGSDVRDLAWIYSLSVEHELAMEMDFAALRNAIAQRNWLSTQDRARLFVLASRLSYQDKDFSAEISFIEGQLQAVYDKPMLSVMLSAEQLRNVSSITAKSNRVYGSLMYTSATKEAPERKSDIIDIEKTFFDLEGYPIGLDGLTSGQLVIVELSLTSNKNIRDALVVDLLPAGFLLENQNLSGASVNLSELEIEGEPVVQAIGLAHQEFREDRYVAALELKKNDPQRLYYLVRATVPGHYQMPPTYVEDMFNPAEHGLGDASKFKINE